MRRPAAAHLVTRMQAATGPANESVKGEVQTLTLLKARLTDDSATDVRLAAVTAIGRVAEKTDPAAN